jgi:hypothetical protein
MGHPFTEQEDRYIISNYRKLSSSMIAEDIGRPWQSVRDRVTKLRKKGFITGQYAQKPGRPAQPKQSAQAAETALTKFNYAAIEDSVRLYLASQVSAHRLTYQASVILMLKLTNHLQQKGAAKLGQMSVLQIVELLQKDQSLTIGETP